MLAEYLSDAQWQDAAPGVRVCMVSGWKAAGEAVIQMQPDQLEIFFCQGGCLLAEDGSGLQQRIRSNAVVIFSDPCSVSALRQEQPLDGVCLSVDRTAAESDFGEACERLHLALRTGQAERLLRRHRGCIHIPNTLWGRTMGAMLDLLPPGQRPGYCVLKSLELFYLLCARDEMLEQTACVSPNWRSLNRTISAMRSYMEDHLDEKLTITAMSRRFQISPTAFKSGFRSLYGQPVHNWLLEKRLEASTKLLLRTSMTVLQIAQEVGYESVGQFNVVFRRQYGVTPSQYRKMSHSKKI